ncbi:MAG TPA: AzlC family ABC transporter permease [Gemmatimonadaceae bacterium]
MSTVPMSLVRTTGGEFAAGARAMLPWLAGIVPFGLVIGVSAARADIPAAGWLTGPAIYAGSAQVATIEMLDAGAAPAVIVATALIINLRLVLYSAAIAAYWRDTPRWWRAAAAYLLVDPSLVVGMDGYQRYADRDAGHRHYLGGAVVLWAVWLTAIGAGVTLGAQLPPALRLELIIPLYLAGEVVHKLGDRATRRAAVTATVIAVAAFAAPLHLGVLLAIIAGLVAALTIKEASR